MAWPRSIRWRYSLRALLIFITLFMLWGGYHVERGRKERAAEAVLRSAQADFVYGPMRTPGVRGSLTYYYQRLVQIIWRERYIWGVTIHAKELVQRPISEDEVEAIALLPYLQSFGIAGESAGTRDPYGDNPDPCTSVPEGAVATVLARCQLRDFGSYYCGLSDADFRAIAEHSSLESLNLNLTNVSDAHLGPILRLPRLRVVNIRGTSISGAGLSSHSGSASLERIYSGVAPLGPEFADFVAKCPRVTYLEAGDPSVDDEFVRRLEGHPALQELYLSRSSVTEQCIPSVFTIPNLAMVSLPKGKATPGVKARFKRARPSVTVLGN